MSARYWVERNLYQKVKNPIKKNLHSCHFWDQTCQFFENQPVPCRDSPREFWGISWPRRQWKKTAMSVARMWWTCGKTWRGHQVKPRAWSMKLTEHMTISSCHTVLWIRKRWPWKVGARSSGTRGRNSFFSKRRPAVWLLVQFWCGLFQTQYRSGWRRTSCGLAVGCPGHRGKSKPFRMVFQCY